MLDGGRRASGWQGVGARVSECDGAVVSLGVVLSAN